MLISNTIVNINIFSYNNNYLKCKLTENVLLDHKSIDDYDSEKDKCKYFNCLQTINLVISEILCKQVYSLN